MAFEQGQLQEINNKAADFLINNRPPEEIRHLLDLDLYIRDQSVILCEVRPDPHKPDSKVSSETVKATYVKNTDSWKIYLKDRNLNWKRYETLPAVEKLQDFFQLVEEDEQGYFISKLVFY